MYNLFLGLDQVNSEMDANAPSCFTLMLRLKVKSDGTAFSFSTRLLHSLLKQSLVKCCEQMLLYFVGLKLFLLIAATHLPQTSGRARGNLGKKNQSIIKQTN